MSDELAGSFTLHQSRSTELSSHDRLDRDVNALVKQVLTDYEELAELPPTTALDPVSYNDRRRRAVRAIWALVKNAKRGSEVQHTVDVNCPDCGSVVRIISHWTGFNLTTEFAESPYSNAAGGSCAHSRAV